MSNAQDKIYIAAPNEEQIKMRISQIMAWIRNAKILQAIDNMNKLMEQRKMNIQRYLILQQHRGFQSGQHIPTRDPGFGYISL